MSLFHQVSQLHSTDIKLIITYTQKSVAHICFGVDLNKFKRTLTHILPETTSN